MNLRVIKKDISFFTEEFVSDALMSLNFIEESKKKEAVVALVNEALVLEDEMRVQISHPKEGEKKGTYYRSLYESFFKSLDEIYTKLSETIHSKETKVKETKVKETKEKKETKKKEKE